jgi:hypothetical protein
VGKERMTIQTQHQQQLVATNDDEVVATLWSTHLAMHLLLHCCGIKHNKKAQQKELTTMDGGLKNIKTTL